MSDKFVMEEEEELSAPFWMTTFSDMVTLLLTFFVLIVSMSEVEVKKFQEALSYFQGSVGVLSQSTPISTMQRQIVASQDAAQAAQYESLIEQLALQNLGDKVQVNLTEKGVHVIITDSVMFRSGEAELIEPSRTVLRLLALLVDERVQAIVVEGHTDDQPISTARFPSNWELSAARAASVVRFLLEQEGAVDPARYVALGFGEHRPVDTAPTPEARARNRRVEILFSWKPWPDPGAESLAPIAPPTPSSHVD